MPLIKADSEAYAAENNITPKSITTKVKDIMEGAPKYVGASTFTFY